MAKEPEKMEKLESYAYNGIVYVSASFIAYEKKRSGKRTVTNWVKKGLKHYKIPLLSKSNLFILEEVDEWMKENLNVTQAGNSQKRKNNNNIKSETQKNFSSLEDERSYYEELDKNRLDELNTTEQIIERKAKNKQHDKEWVRKEKPSQTVKALSRSFISLMKNMMITVSKDGEQKSQDELYHIMDEYLHSEVKKFTNMLKDEGSEIDLHEIYQIMIDLYDDGISINEMVKKLNEIES